MKDYDKSIRWNNNGSFSCLLEMGKSYLKDGEKTSQCDLTDAELCFEAAINEARNNREEAIGKLFLGRTHRLATRFDQADQALSTARQILAKDQRDVSSKILLELASLRIDQGRFDEAARLIGQSQCLCYDNRDVSGEGRAISELGRLKQATNQHREAIKVFAEADLLLQKAGDIEGERNNLRRLLALLPSPKIKDRARLRRLDRLLAE